MQGPWADIDTVWNALGEVVDPEIPVLSIVEMKIVSKVEVSGDSVLVEITPTFSGCPAVGYMKDQVREKMNALGFRHIDVRTNVTKAWSTDLLSAESKAKMQAFGIAPPIPVEIDLGAGLAKPVPCPFCASVQTRLESAFGPTLCKQIYYCDSCRQSFERFKPL